MSSIGAEKAPESKPVTRGAMCTEMMQQASPEGQKAMREFTSERAPRAMANMMPKLDGTPHGRGDLMLDVTRTMETMGSMGGGIGDGRPGRHDAPPRRPSGEVR